MDKLNHLLSGIFCSLCVSAVVSCSSQDEPVPGYEEDVDPNRPHTCELILNISKSDFEDAPQRRSADEWENGDKIHLTFTVGNGISYGDAEYSNGTWNVNYYGSLTEGEPTKCTAVYFDNPEFESNSVVKLTENTGIYEDLNGSYVFSGGTLAVTAELKPKTGRIRFSETDSDEIAVYGISHYTSYDCSNGKFATSIGIIKTKAASGYTPYIYGFFSDEEQPRLNIIMADAGYTRLLSTSVYQAGESGFMSIPTPASHNGWRNSVIFKVNGVEFTMIPVSYSSGNFLLAETETTEELYNAVTGNTSDSNNSQLPTESYNSTFLSKLNVLTELDFRLPTLDEWQHAFVGGDKSQEYTYSGSNTISDVAWYEGNSNGERHPVKQLQPNELGFYDMSGNVWERVTGGYDDCYGGNYNSSESSCQKNSGTDYSSYGFRIALSIN